MKRIIHVVAVGLALVALAGPAAAESRTAQRFEIMFVGDSVNTQDHARIVAVGPITGVGELRLVDTTDQPDGSFVEVYRAELRSGSFILAITGVHDSF